MTQKNPPWRGTPMRKNWANSTPSHPFGFPGALLDPRWRTVRDGPQRRLDGGVHYSRIFVSSDGPRAESLGEGLTDAEKLALERLAERDARNPSAMIRELIRREATIRGLWPLAAPAHDVPHDGGA